jgi:hypothetical protein
MSKHHHAANEAAETPKAIDIAASTMLGDLMACLVDELRMQHLWQAMPEEQQKDAIYRMQERVQANIRVAVEVIASDNRPTIVATVESVTVKDGIKAIVSLPKSDAQRHELFDAQGMSVLLIVGGASGYYGGTDQVKPEPDQPALNGFGDGEMEDAA